MFTKDFRRYDEVCSINHRHVVHDVIILYLFVSMFMYVCLVRNIVILRNMEAGWHYKGNWWNALRKSFLFEFVALSGNKILWLSFDLCCLSISYIILCYNELYNQSCRYVFKYSQDAENVTNVKYVSEFYYFSKRIRMRFKKKLIPTNPLRNQHDWFITSMIPTQKRKSGFV